MNFTPCVCVLLFAYREALLWKYTHFTYAYVVCGWLCCNRTFVENRKYVEMLVAVDTPWQGDFWRQEGLTES